MWLEQTKTTKDWPSCREVSPDCKALGVLKVFLQVIELDHISAVPASLWHLSSVLRVNALALQCRDSHGPLIGHGPSWTRHLLLLVSHLLHTQLLCQGGAHLVLEPALLATAETAPGHGNSQLGSNRFTHAIGGAQEAETRSNLVFPCLQGPYMIRFCFYYWLSAKSGSVTEKHCSSLLSGQKSISAPTHRYVLIF